MDKPCKVWTLKRISISRASTQLNIEKTNLNRPEKQHRTKIHQRDTDSTLRIKHLIK